MALIFPSLISSDLLNLERTIKTLDPYCAGYHIDIMDNHFVPNLTWGAQFANAIAHSTNKKIWVHLMVENPVSIIDRLQLRTGDIVSIHIETKKEIDRSIKKIREKKLIASVAVSPKTDVSECFEFASRQHVEHFLIMSVEPGFSGQQFLASAIDKIKTLAEYRAKNNLNFTIGIDGGITSDTIVLLAQLGIDQFAIASGIFASPEPVEQLKKLNQLIA